YRRQGLRQRSAGRGIGRARRRADRAAAGQQSQLRPGRPSVATLQAALESRALHRLAAELPPAVHSLGKTLYPLPRLSALRLHPSVGQTCLGIGSNTVTTLDLRGQFANLAKNVVGNV